MHADPQRAEELSNIGPPFSSPAWASRVWPNLKTLMCICSGTFATSLPMVEISMLSFQSMCLMIVRLSQ